MIFSFNFPRNIDVNLSHNNVLCQYLWFGYGDVVSKLRKFIIIYPMLLYLHLTSSISHFEFGVWSWEPFNFIISSLSLVSCDWRMMRNLLWYEPEALWYHLVCLPQHGVKLLFLSILEIIEPTNTVQYSQYYSQNWIFFLWCPRQQCLYIRSGLKLTHPLVWRQGLRHYDWHWHSC